MKDEPFTPFPDSLSRRLDIDWEAKAVLARLSRYSARRPANPSRETLACELGISVRTVDRRVAALCEAGLLNVVRQGKKRSNVYYVITQVAEPEGAGELPNEVTHSVDSELPNKVSELPDEVSHWPGESPNEVALVTSNGDSIRRYKQETMWRAESPPPRDNEETAAFVAADHDDDETVLRFARSFNTLRRGGSGELEFLARVVSVAPLVVRRALYERMLDIDSEQADELLDLDVLSVHRSIVSDSTDDTGNAELLSYCPSPGCVEVVSEHRQCPEHALSRV